MRKSFLTSQWMMCVSGELACLETSKRGVRREGRCDIPAASRRNWEEVPRLPVYMDVKTKGDKSRLSKRSMLESVVEQGHRMACSLTLILT